VALSTEGLVAVSGVPLVAVEHTVLEESIGIDIRRTDRASATGRRHRLVLRTRLVSHRLPPLGRVECRHRIV